jgi:hypothetical protein
VTKLGAPDDGEESDDGEPKADIVQSSAPTANNDRPMLCWSAPLERVRSPFERVGGGFGNTLGTEAVLQDRIYPASEALVVANATQGGSLSVRSNLPRDLGAYQQDVFMAGAKKTLESKLREAKAELGLR